MTLKRRDGGSGANGANGTAEGKGLSLFEASPANDGAAPATEPADMQPFLLRFVAPDDPILVRLRPVEDFAERAMCKAQYAERACWVQMSDQEAVAFRTAQPMAEGWRPSPEQFAQVAKQILASRTAAASSVLEYGPTAERTVLVRIPLIKDKDGNFVPDPAVVGTPETTTP